MNTASAWQGSVCTTSALSWSSAPSQDLGSPGKHLLTSKQSHSEREARGAGLAPLVLFPINFSPSCLGYILIMTTMIIRFFSAVVISCGGDSSQHAKLLASPRDQGILSVIQTPPNLVSL